MQVKQPTVTNLNVTRTHSNNTIYCHDCEADNIVFCVKVMFVCAGYFYVYM